jgi:hypothetical protein
MSIDYLREAALASDDDALIRYVRLHLGDGNESTGAREIDKAWIAALRRLIDTPPTNRERIERIVAEESPATLAHLFFRLHFHLVASTGTWIHDGTL